MHGGARYTRTEYTMTLLRQVTNLFTLLLSYLSSTYLPFTYPTIIISLFIHPATPPNSSVKCSDLVSAVLHSKYYVTLFQIIRAVEMEISKMGSGIIPALE